MHFRRSKTAQNSRLGSVQFSVHLGGNSCGPVLLLGDRSFFKDDLCFLRISVLVNWSHISIHWTSHSILPTYHFSHSYLKYWAFGPKNCIHTSIFVLYINVFLVHLISWFTIKRNWCMFCVVQFIGRYCIRSSLSENNMYILTDFPLWYNDLLNNISLTSELSLNVRNDLWAAVSGVMSAEYDIRALRTLPRTITTRIAQLNLDFAYEKEDILWHNWSDAARYWK